MGSGTSKKKSTMADPDFSYDKEPSDIVDFKEIVRQSSPGPDEIIPPSESWMTKGKTKKSKVSDSKHDEFAIKYKQLEKAYHQCSQTTDLESTDLTCWLEFLDTVAVIPRDHPDKWRQRWVKKLLSLGYINLWIKWWILFWKQPFAEQSNEPALIPVRLNFTYALRILWNCTDTSPNVCQQLVQRDGLRQILEKLGDRTSITVDSLKTNQAKRYYVSGLLSIIHNCLRSYPPSKTSFRTSMGVKSVQPFTLCDLDTVKTKAVMILAYGIQEHEQYLIEATDDHLQYILNLAQSAINSADHRCKCFTLVDLLGALNKLATNDENKLKVVDKGGLSIYVRGMREGVNEEEIFAAAQGVWTLAFPKLNKEKIGSEPGCLEILEKLKLHKTSQISKSANGALWMISLAAAKFSKLTNKQKSDETVRIDDLGDGERLEETPEHVMLSYSWDYKIIVKQIKRTLTNYGFNVWIDEDHMSGSILESIAHAVENASVVLVCISDSYKDSPSCRTEAEYAYRLHKPIIPIRTQTDYHADGWLGAFLGNQLYFDCTSDYEVERNMNKIIKELQAKLPTLILPPLKANTRAISPARKASAKSMLSGNTWVSPSPSQVLLANDMRRSVSNASSLNDYDDNEDSAVESDEGSICIRDWTASQVQKWLTGVVGFSDSSAAKFEGFDGRRLRGLKNMHKLSPHSFYQQLSTGLFALALPDLLSLSDAIERIRA